MLVNGFGLPVESRGEHLAGRRIDRVEPRRHIRPEFEPGGPGQPGRIGENPEIILKDFAPLRAVESAQEVRLDIQLNSGKTGRGGHPGIESDDVLNRVLDEGVVAGKDEILIPETGPTSGCLSAGAA